MAYHTTRRAFLRLKERDLPVDRVVETLLLRGHATCDVKDVIRDYYGIDYRELREHCGLMTPVV